MLAQGRPRIQSGVGILGKIDKINSIWELGSTIRWGEDSFEFCEFHCIGIWKLFILEDPQTGGYHWLLEFYWIYYSQNLLRLLFYDNSDIIFY